MEKKGGGCTGGKKEVSSPEGKELGGAYFLPGIRVVAGEREALLLVFDFSAPGFLPAMQDAYHGGFWGVIPLL